MPPLPPERTYSYIALAAVLGALCAWFGRQIGTAIVRSSSFVASKAYRWILPALPSWSIYTYRKNLLKSHVAFMENPTGPRLSVQLEATYAPVTISSGNTRRPIELDTKVDSGCICILLGGAGTGKTTVMKSQVLRCVKRNQRTPIFIELRTLRPGIKVLDALTQHMDDLGYRNPRNYIQSCLKQGRLLVVFDGLDELGEKRVDVVNELKDFFARALQESSRNAFFVTCRDTSYRTNKDLQDVLTDTLHVEPFTSRHIRMFLKGWPSHDGRSALALYSLIQQDTQVLDCCTNPLLLTILTGIYLDKPDFDLPDSRRSFYDEVFDELLVQRQQRRGMKMRFPDKLRKLRLLGQASIENLEQAGDPTVVAEEIPRSELQRISEEVYGKDIDVDSLLDELVVTNAVLRPSSSDFYTLAHRTLQEYLAASYARKTRRPDSILAAFGKRSDLEEVLYFYASLQENTPLLSDIARHFMQVGQWYKAAKCAVYGTVELEADVAEQVIKALREQCLKGTEQSFDAIHLLASLAQRRDAIYGSARTAFELVVEQLASQPQGVQSALEKALEDHRSLATNLLPSLIATGPTQALAFRILRDQDTDESLDSLCRMLSNKETSRVRALAASCLAALLDSRGHQLMERASLLLHVPSVRDWWPYEELASGQVAAILVDCIASEWSSPGEDPMAISGNSAIDAAVTARWATLMHDKSRYLTQWKNIKRDRFVLKLMRPMSARAIGALMGSVVVFLAILQLWQVLASAERSMDVSFLGILSEYVAGFECGDVSFSPDTIGAAPTIALAAAVTAAIAGYVTRRDKISGLTAALVAFMVMACPLAVGLSVPLRSQLPFWGSLSFVATVAGLLLLRVVSSARNNNFVSYDAVARSTFVRWAVIDWREQLAAAVKRKSRS